jgi:hypothetical protein
LILVLGLDARKFTEGQRDAVQAFKKGKEGALDFTKAIEEQGGRMADVLGLARKGALGLIGAFAGGEVASFVGHIVTMDAATGRMAAAVNTSIPNLSLWQEMVKRVGGSADDATSSLGAMQEELNLLKYTSHIPAPGLQSLASQAGINLRVDDADTVYRKVQSFLSQQVSSGRLRPDEAMTFARQAGISNQNILNLMLDNFKKIEAEAKAAGTANNQTAAAAQKLQNAFAATTQTVERFGAALISGDDKGALGALGAADKGTGSDLLGRLSTWLIRKMGIHPQSKEWLDDEDPTRKNLYKSFADQAFGGEVSGGDVDMAPLLAALAAGESGGYKNPYGAIGPWTPRHGRAIGKYQVMEDNIGPWSKEALGRAYSTQEFINDHDAQEKVAALKFGQLVKKYGYDGAARAWLAGEGGMNDPTRHDAFGTGVISYQRKFDQNLGARGAAGSRAAPGPVSNNTSSSEINIGSLNINAPKADDAYGIAGDMGGALKRLASITPINNALV